MSQLSILQRAKQGDTGAIASTINYLLKEHNVNATVSINEGCLKVILESKEILNQETLLPLIHKLAIKLEIKAIDSVRVYGKKVGEDIPLWNASIPLNGSKDKFKTQLHSSGQPKQTLEKARVSKYPMWLPTLSSLWRTFILTIIGLPLAQVVVPGTGLIFLGFASPQLSTGYYLIIALGVILLIASALVISLVHSATKTLILNILPKAQSIFKYSNSL